MPGRNRHFGWTPTAQSLGLSGLARRPANFSLGYRITSAMAYKFSSPVTSFTQDNPLTVAYNVTMKVGQNKPNTEDDVMLVQLCLQQICGHYTFWRNVVTPNKEKIDADGKCGPITKNAIWRFQTQLQKIGADVYPDGVVSPLYQNDAYTSLGYECTLLWLNYLLFYSIGEDRFEDLADQSFTPPLLRSRLRN